MNNGDDAINQGAFWLSNVHKILSFISFPQDWLKIQEQQDQVDNCLPLQAVKPDLESLEFDIYHAWMKVLKRKVQRMIIPAIIESQSSLGPLATPLPASSALQFSTGDLLSLLSKIYKTLRGYLIEESVIRQAITELLKLVGVTAFNDLLLRTNYLSYKRAWQIKHNVERIKEWCASHSMAGGKLELDPLMVRVFFCQL